MKLSTFSLTDPTLPLVSLLFTVLILFSPTVSAHDPFSLSPEVTAEGAVNTLTWTARGDDDVAIYRVEWSPNGMSGWATFGTLKASTDTLNAMRYRVRDQNPRPESYYRIVTVTHTGGETISQVASMIRVEAVTPIKVAYQAAAGAARLDLHLESGGSITVRVLNTNGDAIYRKDMLIMKGRSIKELPLGSIAPGTYTVEIDLPDGNLLTERFEASAR